MIFSINKNSLLEYTLRQIENLFPDRTYNREDILPLFNKAIERIEYCFTKIDNKYYSHEGNSVFNHLNSDQYSMYLYFFSNTLYRGGYEKTLSEKVFLLNKALHGIDVFYEIELPDIFIFVHPLGTVLGRAEYSNYLTVYQKCNVGANHEIYPSLGEYLTLHPGASVLGKCCVGNNCKLATNALLLDADLKDNSLYIGNPKDFSIVNSERKNSIWK